ncbi:RxLR effector protein [Plasmodiophora brassicae]|uniref:RxLR effector protein n=1 Tax=Plasmodiophora brassicae TaxID=37360 RepID=A0A0G4IN97_PLABS|nr:hypothetical protein PBRA_005253 [Plasmodiophora brassicae]SPQ94702.1 unnamed protein product [Plasmodiophora brassicae]
MRPVIVALLAVVVMSALMSEAAFENQTQAIAIARRVSQEKVLVSPSSASPKTPKAWMLKEFLDVDTDEDDLTEHMVQPCQRVRKVVRRRNSKSSWTGPDDDEDF